MQTTRTRRTKAQLLLQEPRKSPRLGCSGSYEGEGGRPPPPGRRQGSQTVMIVLFAHMSAQSPAHVSVTKPLCTPYLARQARDSRDEEEKPPPHPASRTVQAAPVVMEESKGVDGEHLPFCCVFGSVLFTVHTTVPYFPCAGACVYVWVCTLGPHSLLHSLHLFAPPAFSAIFSAQRAGQGSSMHASEKQRRAGAGARARV